MICSEHMVTGNERKRRERLLETYRRDPSLLFDLLVQHSVFTEANDMAQTTLRNWAVRHMEEIGILDEAKLRRALASILEEDAVDASAPGYAPDVYAIEGDEGRDPWTTY